MRTCHSWTKWMLATIAIGTAILIGVSNLQRTAEINTLLRHTAASGKGSKEVASAVSLVNGRDSRCFHDEDKEHEALRIKEFSQLPVQLSGSEVDGSTIERLRLDISGVNGPLVSLLQGKHSGKLIRRIYPCGVPVFLNREKPVVALASIPGSGNTWLRYLLEQLTGVRTGSIYVDRSLYRAGFVGENISNASVLVVKSHTGTVPLRPWYDRSWMDAVILLVRDPYNATLSEFHRRKTGSHLSTAKLANFQQEFWANFSVQMSYRFCDLIHAWLSWNRPTLVVFFEDLVANTKRELTRILRFLRVRVSEKRWRCALNHKEGFFHRKPFKLPTDPFNKTLRLYMENSLRRTARILPEVLVRYSKSI